MVPKGFEFSFVKRNQCNVLFIMFSKTEEVDIGQRTNYFALDRYGNPITGRLTYGIPEGALITFHFNNGYLDDPPGGYATCVEDLWKDVSYYNNGRYIRSERIND
jgi:hypothetical protein